ncbi:type III polyketide synthase [Kitasatospora cinereorecta]
MAVYISQPAIHLPDHLVTRQQLIDDMVARHPDHPRLGTVKRVVGQMPTTRRFSQPWNVVLADHTADERNATAFADVLGMGLTATRQALDRHSVTADQIDCIITSHSTGDAVPGLDVHLFAELGMRPDVRRRPITQLGCGGGGHGLLMAAEAVQAHPGSLVLVVIAESLSSIYHHADTGIEMMIYKALWGDSGTAVLVSDRPLGPGLRIEDTWEYLIPGTHDRYRKRIDHEGVHFDSDKTATQSINEMAPALRRWLARPVPGTIVDSGPAPARGRWTSWSPTPAARRSSTTSPSISTSTTACSTTPGTPSTRSATSAEPASSTSSTAPTPPRRRPVRPAS